LKFPRYKTGFKKRFFLFSCFLFSFVLSLNLFYVFIVAYLNDYEATVLVNKYGEAHLELVSLSLIMVMLSLGMIIHIKELKKI